MTRGDKDRQILEDGETRRLEEETRTNTRRWGNKDTRGDKDRQILDGETRYGDRETRREHKDSYIPGDGETR